MEEVVEVIEQNNSKIPGIPPDISKAISGIMADIKTLKKETRNDFAGYNYANIDAFLEAINPLCAKHGLIIITDEDSCRFENKWVHISYSFILSHTSGVTWNYKLKRNLLGQVQGGQTFGALQSYAVKQFMRGLFLIPTGEQEPDLDGQKPDYKKKGK